MGARNLERGPERSFALRYLHGLNASVRTNASAYGFSVTITATFGLLSTIRGTPSTSEIFAFAGGAIVAFALVEAILSGGFRHGLGDEPARVKTLGSSISFFSVGVALILALVTGHLMRNFAAWPLGTFLATVTYLLVFAGELSVAQWLWPK